MRQFSRASAKGSGTAPEECSVRRTASERRVHKLSRKCPSIPQYRRRALQNLREHGKGKNYPVLAGVAGYRAAKVLNTSRGGL